MTYTECIEFINSFSKSGKELFSVMKMLGIEDVAFNQPKGMLYKDENPFA